MATIKAYTIKITAAFVDTISDTATSLFSDTEPMVFIDTEAIVIGDASISLFMLFMVPPP